MPLGSASWRLARLRRPRIPAFTHLAEYTAPLTQIASALALSERAAARLVYACAALGLVHVTEASPQGFCNTPVAEKYLVEG